MLDVFGFPTPQGANYQEFYGGGTANSVRDWVKPRGVSMVRMLLIGAGGNGGNGTTTAGGGGGGSGAITQWIGPAIFIPDVLRVRCGSAVYGQTTQIIYQQKDGTGYTLLTANNGGGGSSTGTAGTGASASSNNYFGAAGIFKSVAGTTGQAHVSGINLAASTTTFLSGGGGGNSTTTATSGGVIVNYGYPLVAGVAANSGPGRNGNNGYFITQPIMVGAGGGGGGGDSGTVNTGGTGGKGGIGCGGGGGGRASGAGGAGGQGGDGAVFIWSW